VKHSAARSQSQLSLPRKTELRAPMLLLRSLNPPVLMLIQSLSPRTEWRLLRRLTRRRT
jgi:hypothetical protein